MEVRCFGLSILQGLSVSHKEWITASIFTLEAAAGKKWPKWFFGIHPRVCTKSSHGLSATKSHPEHGRFRLAAQSLGLKIQFLWAPTATLNGLFAAVDFLKTYLERRVQCTEETWCDCDCAGRMLISFVARALMINNMPASCMFVRVSKLVRCTY